MFERGIFPEEVLESIRNGEIIKDYPDKKPYPCFLILSFVNERPIHVVIAKNSSDGLCFVVTLYEPDKLLWSNNFKIKLYE